MLCSGAAARTTRWMPGSCPNYCVQDLYIRSTMANKRSDRKGARGQFISPYKRPDACNESDQRRVSELGDTPKFIAGLQLLEVSPLQAFFPASIAVAYEVVLMLCRSWGVDSTSYERF